jgi:hypothetical protein
MLPNAPPTTTTHTHTRHEMVPARFRAPTCKPAPSNWASCVSMCDAIVRCITMCSRISRSIAALCAGLPWRPLESTALASSGRDEDGGWLLGGWSCNGHAKALDDDDDEAKTPLSSVAAGVSESGTADLTAVCSIVTRIRRCCCTAVVISPWKFKSTRRELSMSSASLRIAWGRRSSEQCEYSRYKRIKQNYT